MSSLEILAKSGAIVSSTGIALFVAFVAVLLVFPVVKVCDSADNCSFNSTAPGQLKPIIQPGFLALSLLLVSAGIIMVRFSRRYNSNDKKTESSG